MLIPCPFCGPRHSDEFSYLGDADALKARPAPEAGMQAFVDYVHLRKNPAGEHRELWQHVSGCRAWVVVTRDTRTHQVFKAELARGAA